MNQYVLSLAGGILIGIAASILWVSHGKIMGVSGILGGFFDSKVKERYWRIHFVLGVLFGGYLISLIFPQHFPKIDTLNYFSTICAGLLVGIGTQLGSGCTSGHGVCGISRFSIRSLIATCIFIFFGMLTVAFIKNWGL